MFKIKINDRQTFTAVKGSDNVFQLDDKARHPDIIEIKDGLFHVILDHVSYTAEVLKHDADAKIFEIRVNHNTYRVVVKDQYDELLKELGMDTAGTGKISDLKAPMPGLVVEVAVTEGQEVKKGDKLIVLEAMKMENILKAGSDGTVKKIKAQKGKTVEKNEILVLFN